MSETQHRSIEIALVQLASSGDLHKNFAMIEDKLQDLQGVDLVVLPEMWPLLIPDTRGEERRAHAEQHRDAIFKQLQSWALQTQAVWVGGSVFEPAKEAGKVLNQSWVFSKKGECMGGYAKAHLFDNLLAANAYSESRTVQAGESIEVVEAGFAKIGLSICYDLRFPYHFQALSDLGAELMVLPSAFSYKTGQAHWEVLLRARAIENQCYILACNQTVGSDSCVHCWGNSMVVDPWGEVVASLKEEVGVLKVNLNLDKVKEVRSKMPVLEHRLFKLEKGVYDPSS